MEPGEIREATVNFLKLKGIDIPPTIPLLDQSQLVRTKEQIFCRMMVLHVLGACAYGFDLYDANKWLAKQEIGSALSISEKACLSSSRVQSHYQFAPEAVYTLAWTLNLYKYWQVLDACPDELVVRLPDLRVGQPVDKWLSRANLRRFSDLLKNLDIFYCVHWAFRNAAKSSLYGVGIDLVSLEWRRHALEWLFIEDDWDSISLDT